MSYISSVFDIDEWLDIPGSRFATREEAEHFNLDLRLGSDMITNSRVVESTEPVNARYENGKIHVLNKHGRSYRSLPTVTKPRTNH